ncbi:alpha/beta-hydrolase [Sanghuangporus baumii]|uniref:Alpha/beta-hydrolase n=1 Tax=Sanghuangporus baumii TaxID=108892 RepID=A0A9Q5N4X6_SANBA|nr:alpha/beta-hydrolase [Sanghuangporus baumii]
MPYIDFVSKDDRVSLWYTTNSRMGGVGDFGPDKPIVVMLHPLFLDSTWLTNQFEDPRLTSRYNLLAFDMRCAGRSNARPSGAHDTWVDAADLAFALLALGLPPAHILAIENISVNTALRLAALFPELCLSLTLVNVPPPTELEWVFDTYGELLSLWCHPTDLDEYEHALLEMTTYFLGKDAASELKDELIAYWSTQYPPWRRSRVYELFHCVLNRIPLSDPILACITQPTLIIQSDKTEINPIRYANKLAASLLNAEGKARVHTIRGSPEYVTVVPTCATIVNRVVAEFLSRQTRPHVSSRPQSIPAAKRRERLQEALMRLSELMDDASIATRDPSSPLSFSFSERYNDHWFQAEKDEDTAKPTNLNKEEKLKALEKLVTQTEVNSAAARKGGTYLSAQEPVSSEVARSGRLRRSTISKHVVEKATIGGSNSNFAPALISNTLHMSKLRF